MGKYMLNEYRTQRILELCVKHSQDLPDDIRAEVDAMLNDETRKNETQLKDIPFSTRTKNVLWCARCDTIADVLAYGKNRFLSQRNCGKTTCDEIEAALGKLGFTLPERGEEKKDEKENKACKDNEGNCAKELVTMISSCIGMMREVKEAIENGEVCNCQTEENRDFLLRCAADSMYAMIRRVEGTNRTQCTELLDGRCSSKCKRFDICYWRQLRSVADEYEKVRKEGD